jgi:antitoxin CcdA
MMSERQDRKRAVSLSVDAELLDEAQRLGVNLSATLEDRLRRLVNPAQEKRWLEQNHGAITSINAFIDEHGLLASRLRYRPD